MRKMCPKIVILVLLVISDAKASILCPRDTDKRTDADRVLYFENYNIGIVEKNVFDGAQYALPLLDTVILRDTRIRQIKSCELRAFRRVKCLDLSNNQLTIINADTYSGLSSYV